jgi:hypothetical protein
MGDGKTREMGDRRWEMERVSIPQLPSPVFQRAAGL